MGDKIGSMVHVVGSGEEVRLISIEDDVVIVESNGSLMYMERKKIRELNQNSFSIGDKVKLKGDSEFHYQAPGEIGTIREINKGDRGFVGDDGHVYKVVFESSKNTYRDFDLTRVDEDII